MKVKEKKSLIGHNLLDENFYNDIYNSSDVLKNYRVKITSISNELDYFLEDLFYIFYKHIVYLETGQDTHYFLLKNIIESTAFNKLKLRTRGSTFETYLVLKYFIDQILIRLKGRTYIDDINSYYKNMEGLNGELSILKDDIEEIIADDFYSADLNQRLIEMKILEIISRSIRNTKIPLYRGFNDIFKGGIMGTSTIVIDSFLTSKENELDSYGDFLKDLLSNLSSKDDLIYESFPNELKEGDLNDEIGNPEDYMNKSKTEASNEESSDSLFKKILLDKLKAMLEDNSHRNDTDTDDFLNSLLDEIKELEALINNNDSNDGSLSLHEDSSKEAQKADDFLDFNSKNTKLSLNTSKDFSAPNVNLYEGGTDENIIIDGKSENEVPLFEEILRIQSFINEKTHRESKSLISSPSLNNIFLQVINRLEDLKARVIKNENQINQLSKNLSTDRDLNNALEKLSKSLKSVKTLGINEHSLSSLGVDQAIELEKRLRSSDFKKFIDKIGKKKIIANQVKRKKRLSKDNIIDKIILSDDMDNIIEDEILQFSLDIEEFEWDFYDRFLNSSIYSNEFMSNYGKNKGPIILCYDGSGSMEGDKIEETKAHIIAIMDIARTQKRKMILIQFASRKEELFIKEINPSYISTYDIYEIYDTFIKGGTDFEKPLNKSIEILRNENYRDGDILFITDGHCEISSNFMDKFNFAKKNHNFKLYSIIIHGHTYKDFGDLAKISNEVLEIKKSNLNDWNEKISEKIFSII